MKKSTLNKIVADIKTTYPGADVFITEDDTIGWESGMEWTFDYCDKWVERDTKPVEGVYVGPVSHWELGVYKA